MTLYLRPRRRARIQTASCIMRPWRTSTSIYGLKAWPTRSSSSRRWTAGTLFRGHRPKGALFPLPGHADESDPDGHVKKTKSRFCVRGDCKNDMDPWETYAPVVSSSTVRLVLIMCMVFGLTTWCMDFTNAFVHAELSKDERYCIGLPKGCSSKDGSDSVLLLKCTLYGSRALPKCFFTVLRDSYLR
jgi:hypothetical protein